MKYIIRAGIVLILLISLWAVYNTRWLWLDYLTSPPMNFIENEDISLALYPEGYRSASVFTNSGACADTASEFIDTLRIRLVNLGIPGTFFVSAFQTGREELTKNHRQLWELIELQQQGFEISQDCQDRKSAPGGWEDNIKDGRAALISLGLRVEGYRSPLSSPYGNINKYLNRKNYLYNYISPDPPITFRTFLFSGCRRSIIFPSHPEGGNLLEVVSGAEPVIRPEKARKKFKNIHSRGGVFIFRTELPRVMDDKNLAILEDFLRYIKEQDTWLCTLKELCDWWLAREKVDITTHREGNVLTIIYDNQEPIEMRNARISFKKYSDGPEIYRVMNRSGEVSAEGFIPESGWINVTLFPSGRE
ncbi:MAG: hypothetical protein U9N73_10665 [Candidatus Auribacterota bacterium]|nr:hypothetical protein [Candidatus Auribacterota bacterium]